MMTDLERSLLADISDGAHDMFAPDPSSPESLDQFQPVAQAVERLERAALVTVRRFERPADAAAGDVVTGVVGVELTLLGRLALKEQQTGGHV